MPACRQAGNDGAKLTNSTNSNNLSFWDDMKENSEDKTLTAGFSRWVREHPRTLSDFSRSISRMNSESGVRVQYPLIKMSG
ncbi:MAG TPA: hypothetical protein DHW42_07995 [Candidatus Marinimicrobia bacterium]|nr:hypothetical protein [Candidatus Neomarinimicrobiota bacterium]